MFFLIGLRGSGQALKIYEVIVGPKSTMEDLHIAIQERNTNPILVPISAEFCETHICTVVESQQFPQLPVAIPGVIESTVTVDPTAPSDGHRSL